MPAPMMGGILSQLGPLGLKNFFVQTVAENSDELSDVLAQAGSESRDEMLSQVS